MQTITPLTTKDHLTAMAKNPPRNARLYYSGACPVCGKPQTLTTAVAVASNGEKVTVRSPRGLAETVVVGATEVYTAEEAAARIAAGKTVTRTLIGGNCARKLGADYRTK